MRNINYKEISSVKILGLLSKKLKEKLEEKN